MNKKSQAWGIDLIIAVIIFTAGITFFYLYSLNSSGSEDKFETLSDEGKLVSSIILSDGEPIDWNSGNVRKLGILSNNEINETKLEMFYQIATSDYSRTKILFNTGYDYLFFLSENMTIDSNLVQFIGKPGYTPENIQSENVAKTSRFTIYKKKPVTAYLYLWEN
ncbi:MAG: hypothetical protein ABH840_04740 [Nanoarchaeota archaeon]